MQLHSDPAYKFNVTIRSIYNSNQGDVLCTYGGYSMYDIAGQGYHGISTICKHTKRNIYSQTSTMLLVVYSFREYGSFSVELEFSTTGCTVWKIKFCTGYIIRNPSFVESYKIPSSGRIFFIDCTIYPIDPDVSEQELAGGIPCSRKTGLIIDSHDFISRIFNKMRTHVYLTGSLKGKLRKIFFCKTAFNQEKVKRVKNAKIISQLIYYLWKNMETWKQNFLYK